MPVDVRSGNPTAPLMPAAAAASDRGRSGSFAMSGTHTGLPSSQTRPGSPTPGRITNFLLSSSKPAGSTPSALQLSTQRSTRGGRPSHRPPSCHPSGGADGVQQARGRFDEALADACSTAATSYCTSRRSCSRSRSAAESGHVHAEQAERHHAGHQRQVQRLAEDVVGHAKRDHQDGHEQGHGRHLAR